MVFKNKSKITVLYLCILSAAAFADTQNFKINNNTNKKQQGNWQLRKVEEIIGLPFSEPFIQSFY